MRQPTESGTRAAGERSICFCCPSPYPLPFFWHQHGRYHLTTAIKNQPRRYPHRPDFRPRSQALGAWSVCIRGLGWWLMVSSAGSRRQALTRDDVVMIWALGLLGYGVCGRKLQGRELGERLRGRDALTPYFYHFACHVKRMKHGSICLSIVGLELVCSNAG